jgi:hypothetical protein
MSCFARDLRSIAIRQQSGAFLVIILEIIGYSSKMRQPLKGHPRIQCAGFVRK